MAESELLIEVARRLARVQAEWMVTGSVAATFHGVIRSTHDIDLVIDISPAHIRSLVDAFPEPEFYADYESARTSLPAGMLFNIIHNPTGTKIDLWPLRDKPFDNLAFDKRRLEHVGDFKVPVVAPSELILQKLTWARELGGSEKQLTDAIGIYETRLGEIDPAHMDHWALRIGVSELWDTVKKRAKPM